MRILLDECVPAKLSRELVGHEVRTVRRMGWGSFKNGDLLRQAEGVFDVFLTVDQGIRYQQQVPPNLALVTLLSFSNDIDVLIPAVPAILEALDLAKPGQDFIVDARGS